MSKRRNLLIFSFALQSLALNAKDTEIEEAFHAIDNNLPSSFMPQIVKYGKEAPELADLALMTNSHRTN